MPSIDEVTGTLAGTSGVILDGMVEVSRCGKWSHQRFAPKDAEPFWTTTVEGFEGPQGSYRLRLRFGDHLAEMRGWWNGSRFTGHGAAHIVMNAAKEAVA